MDYDIDYLGRFTHLTHADRTKLEQYRHRLSEQEKIELQKIQTDLYFQLKKEHFNTSHKIEFGYGCLLLALAKMQKLDPDIRRVRDLSDLTPAERKLQYQRRFARLEDLKKEKNSPKKAFILRHFEEFEEMLNIGFSWRQLAAEIGRRWSKIGRINDTYLRTVMTAERKRREIVHERIGDAASE